MIKIERNLIKNKTQIVVECDNKNEVEAVYEVLDSLRSGKFSVMNIAQKREDLMNVKDSSKMYRVYFKSTSPSDVALKIDIERDFVYLDKSGNETEDEIKVNFKHELLTDKHMNTSFIEVTRVVLIEQSEVYTNLQALNNICKS